MSQYYYLIASLPDLSLEDNKLNYTVASFKEELYDSLTEKDKPLIDLFYLQYDNANVLRLLKDKEAEIDPRGKYTAEELNEYIAVVQEGGEVNPDIFPFYLSSFVAAYFEASEENILWEDKLAAYYYDYGMKCENKFISDWFAFNLNINNILVALTARKYKWEVAPLIVGDTPVADALRTSSAREFGLSTEVDYLEDLIKITETPELIDREKRVDTLRWNWLEDATFFNYFTVERLFAFLVKLEMIERWIALDKEKGNQLFRSMIDSLKNNVQIPDEFKK